MNFFPAVPTPTGLHLPFGDVIGPTPGRPV